MSNLMKYLPVKKEELGKFFAISVMMILILFIYSVQRTIKDTIVVSYMGAELISAIKLWGVLPSAILVMLLYAKLSDIFNKTLIFHLFNAFFVAYFAIFSFYLFPNSESFKIDLSGAAESLPYLRYVFVVVEWWSYSLYYILSELWGSVMLSLLFWQTVNQIFKIKEAKRLYPLFAFVGQVGMLMSGGITRFFTKHGSATNWSDVLMSINTFVIFAAILLSIAFWILSNKLVDISILNAETAKKKKKKIGFLDGLKHVFTSKYIGLITMLVLCYGASINLVEGVWKAQAHIVYSLPIDYANFMANLQTYTGLAAMVSMLIGSYLLSLISWRFAAMITPVVIFFTSVIFFTLSIYQVEAKNLMTFITVTPIVVAVFVGLLQNILGKSTKYAFFDATKEMSYIPLDEELKSKGKAAVEVIGGRMGKSAGSFVTHLMLSIIPGSTLISLSPSMFVIFLVIMVIWFISANSLATEFDKISEKQVIKGK
ncbi:MAG: AAA family ATP:ADP antiporter [Candidatus Midichloriaceae bacterium]|jgi:AAA family ATP:ADP antiporter